MSQHASLYKKETKHPAGPARIIPIQHDTEKKKRKEHTTKKTAGNLPQINNERIFKVKEHDPL